MLHVMPRVFRLLPRDPTRVLAKHDLLLRRLLAPCSSYGTADGNQKQKINNLQKNFNPKKKWTPKKQIMKHSPLTELLLSNKSQKNNIDQSTPVLKLETLVQSTEKSIKQSYLLLSDPELIQGYRDLLRDVTESISSSTPAEDIIKCLYAVARICQRQDAFLDLNETRISLHPTPNDALQTTCASILPEEAKELFVQADRILNITSSNCLTNQRLNNISNSCLVDLAWSYAVTHQSSANILRTLKEELLHQDIHGFTEAELCKMLDTFAMDMSINAQDLFGTIEHEVLRQGPVGFQTQELPILLFSFVSKDLKPFKLICLIKNDLTTRDIRVLDAVDLSRIIWSFAKVKNEVKSLDMIKLIEAEILRRGTARFGERGLAVLLWSLTELNYFSKDLLTLLKKEICKRNQKKFLPHDISIFLWSFAKGRSRVNSHVLFGVLDKELNHRGMSEFSPSELALTLWSLAEAGHGTRGVLIKLKKEVLSRGVTDFKPVNLSQIVWAFAKIKAKIDIKDVFEYLGEEITRRYNIKRLSLRQVALILWSFAVSENIPKELFARLHEEVLRRGIEGCNNAILCQILFSVASGRDALHAQLCKKILSVLVTRDLGSFHNLQLATVATSIAEIDTSIAEIDTSITEIDEGRSTPQLVHALGCEIQNRNISVFMPSAICRLIIAFTKFNAMTLKCGTTLRSLIQELSRRGMSEFSNPEVVMLLVSVKEARELSPEVFQFFKGEILARNAREFSGFHLSALAKGIGPIHGSEDILQWIEDEAISRSVPSFMAAELVLLLQVFTELGRAQRMAEAVKDQILSMGQVQGYNLDVFKQICELLERNGVDTSEISPKMIT